MKSVMAMPPRPKLSPVRSVPAASPQLCELIASAGGRSFPDKLAQFFATICATRFVHVFEIVDSRPNTLIAIGPDDQSSEAARHQTVLYDKWKIWENDASMSALISTTSEFAVFTDTKSTVPDALRSIWRSGQAASRTMFCGRSSRGVLGFSLMQTQNSSAPVFELTEFSTIANLAFAAIRSHVDTMASWYRFTNSLQDFASIELQLKTPGLRLSNRQRQVAARILFGLTSHEIANELEIDIETVVSHRKRLYYQLDVASQRELMIWYLRLVAGHGETG